MSRPPYTAYSGPLQQQPSWNQQGKRQGQAGAGSLPPPPPPPTGPAPTPPTTIKPEHAALYANYGYGARWQPPPPQQPMAPPLAPQQYPAPMPGRVPPTYAQPPYGVHGYQAQPIMYIQPPQPLVQSAHPQHMMHPHQHQHHYPSHPAVPQMASHQHVLHPTSHQPITNNPNAANAQRFPPAKRPRFDNGRPSGPIGGPSSSFSASNTSVTQPPSSTPPPQPPGPLNPSLPLPPPPLPMSGGLVHNQSGRLSSQQPPFKPGRGGSSQSSSRGRLGGHHTRGGGNASRGGASNATNNRTTNANRGGLAHGGGRGAFRNTNNVFKPSGSSSSFTSGISSSSFNPQLLNGQSLTNLNRSRHGHGLSGSRRDESSRKTLTDFRIIGVDCPLLGWAWGAVVFQGDDIRGETDDSGTKSTHDSRATTPNPGAPDAGTQPEDYSLPLPGVQSAIKPPHNKTSTETSRIRIYFNSPVELEDKPSQSYAPDRSRGGKRKKEPDDGEPQESGKRKKEDPEGGAEFTPPTKSQQQHDSLFLNPASLHNPLAIPGQESSPQSPPHESPSGIGAKRKADDDTITVTTHMDTHGPAPEEQEAETEYAGSPRRGDQRYDEAAPPSIHSVEMDENEEIIPETQEATEPVYDEEQNTLFGLMSPTTENSEQKQDELEAAALLSDSAASRTGTDSRGAEEEHTSGNRAPEDDNIPTVKMEPSFGAESGTDEIQDEVQQEETQPVEPIDTSSSLSAQSVGMFPTAVIAPIHRLSTPAPSVVSPIKPPSPNRVSISYAGSSRRLVLDAEIIQHVKIYRAKGRIEVSFVLERYDDPTAIPATVASAPEPLQPAAENAAGIIQLPSGKGGSESYKGEDNESVIKNTESSASATVEYSPLDEGSGQGPLTTGPGDFTGASTAQLVETPAAASDVIPQIPSRCRGILVEVFSETSKEYVPIAYPAKSADPTLPDFSTLLQVAPTVVNLTAYLDRIKPLSEPKWVRTGDIEEWLSAVFNSRATKGPEAREVWSGKIEVTDPDPVPTMHTIFENWITSSGLGVGKDRRRFVKEHLTASTDNLFDILLRIVRGSPTQPPISATSSLANGSSSSLLASSASGSTAAACTTSLMQAVHQTPLSAAVLGLYQMIAEYSGKAGEDSMKVFDRIGDLIRTLPQHQLQRSIEWIFKDWASLQGINITIPGASVGGSGGGAGRKK